MTPKNTSDSRFAKRIIHPMVRTRTSVSRGKTYKTNGRFERILNFRKLQWTFWLHRTLQNSRLSRHAKNEVHPMVQSRVLYFKYHFVVCWEHLQYSKSVLAKNQSIFNLIFRYRINTVKIGSLAHWNRKLKGYMMPQRTEFYGIFKNHNCHISYVFSMCGELVLKYYTTVLYQKPFENHYLLF